MNVSCSRRDIQRFINLLILKLFVRKNKFVLLGQMLPVWADFSKQNIVISVACKPPIQKKSQVDSPHQYSHHSPVALKEE